MYLNFSKTEESQFYADICIIGAGAAGFSCALSFLNSNLKVLVLEGGLKEFNKKAADLHIGEVAAQPHEGIHKARERIVGGTTTTWGGQAYPFLKQDFEQRKHVHNSGWPISFEDLEPYYLKAEKILGTDSSVPFNYRPWNHWNVTEPDFSPSKIELFVSKWCKIPNFALHHGNTIESSDHIHILSNSNVVELLPTTLLNAVKELHIRSLCGKTGVVKARYFIAAGGALETVRLFLSSTKFGKKGLGNANDLVGCYFQDHVGAVVGRVVPISRKYFHELFEPFYKKGFKYLPRIQINPFFAQKSKILHASAQMLFNEEENSVLNDAKSCFNNIKNGNFPTFHQLRILLQPLKILQLLGATYRWKLFKRGTFSKKGPIWLEIHSEQEPKRESFAELNNQTDDFGMKRIKLNWHISDLTLITIKRMAQIIAEEFKQANLGEVVLEPWIYDENFDPRLLVYDTYHQAGGLRMDDNINNGIVDSSCRVFGIDNLYVASAAVFPSSSFSNPTMTVMALAIRISEKIQSLLKQKADNTV